MIFRFEVNALSGPGLPWHPASAKGATTSQLALAWLLAQGRRTWFRSPAAATPKRVARNTAAADLQLTAA